MKIVAYALRSLSAWVVHARTLKQTLLNMAYCLGIQVPLCGNCTTGRQGRWSGDLKPDL